MKNKLKLLITLMLFGIGVQAQVGVAAADTSLRATVNGVQRTWKNFEYYKTAFGLYYNKIQSDARYPLQNGTGASGSWNITAANSTLLNGYGTSFGSISGGGLSLFVGLNSIDNTLYKFSIASAQNALGLSNYELLSNKKTSLASPDNIGYPTTQAVANAIAAIPPSGVITVNGRNGNVTGLAEQTSLQSEIDRATAAEATKATTSALTTETNARIAADALKANQTDLTAEVSRATTAESVLQANINKAVSYTIDINGVAAQNFVVDSRLIGMLPTQVFKGTFYSVNTTASDPLKNVVFDTTTGRITFPENMVSGEVIKVTYAGSGNISYVPGSVATSSDLNNLVITPDKTSFIKSGKNIFNKFQTITLNALISGAGTVVTNVAYTSNVTDYIKVDPSGKYIQNLGSNIGIAEFSSKSSASYIKQTSTFNNTTPVTVTSTTNYVRLIIYDLGNTLQLEKIASSDNSPTAYEEFYYLDQQDQIKFKAAYLTPELSATIANQTVSNIPDNSITPQKTTFFQVGKNQFDKTQVLTANALLTNSGTVVIDPVNYSNRIVTDYILLDMSTYPTGKMIVNVGFNTAIAEYDLNKTLIRFTSTFNSASPLTPLSTTKFIRMQLFTDYNLNIFQFEVISSTGTAPTAYETFSRLIKSVYLPTPPDLTPFVQKRPGKNIFDKAQAFTANALLSSTGVTVDPVNYANRLVSDYMVIDPSTSYITTYGSNTSFARYTKDKVFIGITSTFNSASSVTTESNAVYARIQLFTDMDLDVFMIRKTTESTSYAPFKLEINVPLSLSSVRESVPGISNRMAFPAKEYFLKNYENRIYYKQSQQKWNPYMFHPVATGTGTKTYNGRMSITPTASSNITLSLYDAEFDLLQTKNITTVVGDPSTSTNPIVVLNYGDSWTQPMDWQYRVKELMPNVNFVGTRKGIPAHPGVGYTEGRSGWLINNDFIANNTHAIDTYYAIFMQPIDPYKYYAGTGMWKAILSAGSSNSMYDIAVSIGFNATTGYKNSPLTNDVMWSDVNNRYERYDGSAWVADVTYSSLGFSYNIAKYRSVYSIPLPQVFSFMFGINDFSGLTPTQFTAAWKIFKTRLDLLIASAKADNPNIKFAIQLPVGTFPSEFDNANGTYAPLQSVAMFLEREQIINNYDGRESENIYVVDCGSAIDPDFGYRKLKELPFPEYQTQVGYTEEMRTVYADYKHTESGTGFRELGTRMIAFLSSLGL